MYTSPHEHPNLYSESAGSRAIGFQVWGLRARGERAYASTRCQKEQCAAEKTACCRAYLDMGTFFMSTIREVQWTVEKWCNVRPEVTQVVRALYESGRGKYETAYGLTDAFDLSAACFQGCNQSPTRSKFQLRLVQEAVRKMCEGFQFRGGGKAIPEMWYCDDGAFVTKDLATLQMVMDTCWMVTRAAGLKIMIKGTKKTAWQATYWAGSVEKEVDGWVLRLPDGRVIPQVRESAGKAAERTYKYLGVDEKAKWQDAQGPVRRRVVQFCRNLMGMVGRVGILNDDQTRQGMQLGTEGSMGFYARTTVIGEQACEMIEAARGQALRQAGIAAGTPRIQVHASRDAGGLGHRHALQGAAASLADQFERLIMSSEDTPGRAAVMAHIRATYIRLGWEGDGHMLEWHPMYLEGKLNNEMVVEAWLDYRLRTGIRMSVTGGGEGREGGGEMRRDAARGPHLWEADETGEWTPGGVCRVEIGLRHGGEGKVGVRVTNAQACVYTKRSRRLAARGIVAWGDITHKEGRWLTWAEVAGIYMKDGGADSAADAATYGRLIDELEEERWRERREKWWGMVGRGEGATAEANVAAQEETAIGKEGAKVEGIWAARRTAKCLGEWEYLVEWDTGGRSWEPKHALERGMGAMARREMMRVARERRYVAESMHERITGESKEGQEEKDRQMEWRTCEGMTADEWREAVTGDLKEARVKRAVRKMWKVHKRHAAAVHGEGREEAGDINSKEMASAAATAASGRPIVNRKDGERTLYMGGEEAVDEDGKKKKRDRAGLEGEEGEGGKQESVTMEAVRQRVALWERLRAAGHTQADTVLPEGQPHTWVKWDEEAQGREMKGIWEGEVNVDYEGQVMGDPLLRVLARVVSLESETGARAERVAVTPDGVQVEIDEREINLLNSKESHAEDIKVMRTAMALHTMHKFTDVWGRPSTSSTGCCARRPRRPRIASGSISSTPTHCSPTTTTTTATSTSINSITTIVL